MMQLLKKFRLIYGLMDQTDKRKLLLIFIVSMLNGVVSAAVVASVLPFVGLISDPGTFHSNEHIVKFCEIMEIDSYAGAVIAFGFLALLLLLLSNVISACDSWYGEVFGSKKELALSTRLLHNYLKIDALEFERKNSGERAKSILSDVERVIITTLFSMLDLVSEVIIALFVIALLLWVNWAVTLVVFAVLVAVHFLINMLVSPPLDRYGKQYAQLQATIYSHVLEALKLHKEIKLADIHPYFLNRYSGACNKMVRTSLMRSLISDIPAYLLELVAFSIILAVAIYFTLFNKGDTQPVTVIGVYAVAAYRLIPAIARIFNKIESIWYDTAILEDVAHALQPLAEVDLAEGTRQELARSIVMQEIYFDFGESSPFHMEALNLEFPINRFTCIKGRTGCGKSTVLNLLSGLYKPISGQILADGVPVDAYRSKWWQSRIGLVPPVLNVINVSIYENVALGVEVHEINRERVREVCRMVDLDELVSGLPKGYESVYGEEGLTFSSGQVQKLGIARALYRKPAILLLDESTDAFDLKTESLVLDRLKAIDGMTIIFVSHRPSVMEHADHLIDLEEVL